MTEHEACTSQRGSSQIHINPLPSYAPAHCIPERQAAIHSTLDSFYRINQSTQWGLLLSKGPGHLELWVKTRPDLSSTAGSWRRTTLRSNRAPYFCVEIWWCQTAHIWGGGMFTDVCRSVNGNKHLFDRVSSYCRATQNSECKNWLTCNPRVIWIELAVHHRKFPWTALWFGIYWIAFKEIQHRKWHSIHPFLYPFIHLQDPLTSKLKTFNRARPWQEFVLKYLAFLVKMFYVLVLVSDTYCSYINYK